MTCEMIKTDKIEIPCGKTATMVATWNEGTHPGNEFAGKKIPLCAIHYEFLREIMLPGQFSFKKFLTETYEI